MGKEDMRGLQHFIADIRACSSAEAELKRINKELANIRQKFGEKKGLNGYQKKKYICKLVYIFLLGHDIEFGYLEAINLLSSSQYSEKQMGYLFVSVMMTESHELMGMVIEAMKSDLSSRAELNVCLALHCIANIGGKVTAQECGTLVRRLLVADEAPNSVKKKASLAMLRLYREAPDQIPIPEFSSRFAQLLVSPDPGVVTAATSLLTTLAADFNDDLSGVVKHAVTRLHRIVMKGDTPDDPYVYYHVPSPWITVKLLRLLQLYPYPVDDNTAARLNETLGRLLSRVKELPRLPSGGRVRVQYFNVNHACFVEAVNLIAHYDNSADLQIQAVTILGDFLVHKEVNMRFLALESMSVMAGTKFSKKAVKKHLVTVQRALRDESDSTVQRRAVDVLYALCDEELVQEVVAQLLDFLKRADYSIREELALKIAILSERFVGENFSWYVDVMVQLIKTAGDHVPPEVWYRVIQVVVNRQDVQDYAAKAAFEALLDPAVHQTMVNIGGYILGEFGHLIANDPLSAPTKQLELVQMHYPMVDSSTRALLITTYVKLANLFPELKPHIIQLLKAPHFLKNSDAELQQRANEYVALLTVSKSDVSVSVLEEMPPFTDAQTTLLQRLELKRSSVTDEGTGTLAARKRVTAEKALELGEVSAVAHTAAQKTETTTITNDAFFEPFHLSNDGVLYQNQVLQIGVKSEFHSALGRLSVYYGNLGDTPITGLSTRAYTPNYPDALKIDVHEIEATLSPGVQLKQQIDVECLSVFDDPPILEVSLNYQGRVVVLAMKLPVLLNKFMEPLAAPMDAQTFFKKWAQLGGPPREVKQVIKGKEPIDVPTMKDKVVRFGLPLLSGIDPKPQNAVSAGILHTRTSQIGALLRVEPNIDAQMYRFTLRTSNETVSAIVANLLVSNF